MNTSSPHKNDKQLNHPPPVLGSWRNLYILVLINLASLIGLFYVLTEVYS